MTIDEMFNELENKMRDTYIVTLKYKYEFEEKYTIENHILEYDSITDSYVWLNDWNEGQTDVEVLGYMILGDVDTTKLESCDDSISRIDLIAAMHLIMDDAKIGDNDEDYESLDDIKEQYIEIAKGMVSVKPEVKWIPVTEKDEKELLTADERADVLNALNDTLEKFGLEVCSYEDDGTFFDIQIWKR